MFKLSQIIFLILIIKVVKPLPQNVGECLISSAKYPHEYLTFDILNKHNQNKVFAFQSVTIQNEETIKWELIEEESGSEVYFFRNKISGKYMCANKNSDPTSEHSIELSHIDQITTKMVECKWRIMRSVAKSGLPSQIINNVYYDQNLAAGSNVLVNAIKSKRNIYLTNKGHISEDVKWFLDFN